MLRDRLVVALLLLELSDAELAAEATPGVLPCVIGSIVDPPAMRAPVSFGPGVFIAFISIAAVRPQSFLISSWHSGWYTLPHSVWQKANERAAGAQEKAGHGAQERAGDGAGARAGRV